MQKSQKRRECRSKAAYLGCPFHTLSIGICRGSETSHAAAKRNSVKAFPFPRLTLIDAVSFKAKKAALRATWCCAERRLSCFLISKRSQPPESEGLQNRKPKHKERDRQSDKICFSPRGSDPSASPSRAF